MDINTLLHSVTEPAVHRWFRAQCANTYGHFYLFARKARPGERIAAPIIAEDLPSDEYFLAMVERVSPAWTQQQALYRCVEALRTAPILGV